MEEGKKDKTKGGTEETRVGKNKKRKGKRYRQNNKKWDDKKKEKMKIEERRKIKGGSKQGRMNKEGWRIQWETPNEKEKKR